MKSTLQVSKITSPQVPKYISNNVECKFHLQKTKALLFEKHLLLFPYLVVEYHKILII